MLRNRFLRFPKGGRNPSNLHVISTASMVNNKPLQQITQLPQQQMAKKQPQQQEKQSEPLQKQPPQKQMQPLKKKPQQQQPQHIPSVIPDTNTQKIMFKNKYRKGQRRQRKRDTKRLATRTLLQTGDYHWYNPSYVIQVESTEKEAEIPEAPVEDTFFEEVEVASSEGEGKQIPVGFRKTKLYYLSYKRNLFFKPKVYKLCSERTIVNCLNVEDNVSVDVDIVSEAEYEDENENLERSDSQEKLGMILEIEEESANDIVDQVEEQMVIDNEVSESSLRNYKICIEGDNDNFIQGKSLFQKSIDLWDSHLIGLEYLIEIRSKNKDVVLKYNCALCSEDLEMQDAVCVINHVNGHKHIVNYLDKHFPACGYKFDENGDYNFIVLQKLCEKINQNLGYYFMCITNVDYYAENEKKIKEAIENASHPNEENFELDKITFHENVISELTEDVNNVLDHIIEKIPKKNKKTSVKNINKDIVNKSELNSQASNLQSDSVDVKKIEQNKTPVNGEKLTKSVKKEVTAPKPVAKYKGNSSISSYLRLSYAATTKFKPAKEKSNKSVISKDKQPNEVIETTPKPVIETTSKPTETTPKPSTETTPKSPNTKNLESTASTEAAESNEAICSVECDASEKINKNKEKNVLKPTMHSKHCRKRILDREHARLAAKASAKGRFITGVSDKLCSVKYKPVAESIVCDTSTKITSEKIKEEFRQGKMSSNSSYKKSFLQKVMSEPVQKLSAVDSQSSLTNYSSPHHKILHKKIPENSSKNELNAIIKDSASHWKPMRVSRSPVRSPTSEFIRSLRSPDRRQSRSPVKRNVRRHSKSPLRRDRSPLKQIIRDILKSPPRRYSRSPQRRDSRSPKRRDSRSPLRRKSRSPIRRRSRSPYRKFSRSPIKRKSRSPVWKFSRSPVRRKSKSPLRRYSRSPLRHSRSPLRHSRSPLRHSRSPLRRRSRSPLRRRSRSPLRRRSRSPIKKRSRSPLRRHSRSPLKRRSRSPRRRQSRSPGTFRSLHKIHSGSSLEHRNRSERFSSNMYDFPKHLNPRESEFAKMRMASKMMSPPKSSKSDKFKSRTFPSSSLRGIISDLDPVSDEDESIYFGDKHQREDTNISSSSKMMSKILQKFSVPDVNVNDPALSRLMQFMEAHSAEIEEFIGSQSKPGKMNISNVDSNLHERSLFLQQYLLSNLAGSNQGTRPLSMSDLQLTPKFAQPSFMQDNILPGFVPPPPSNIPPQPVLPQPIQPRFFPPNVNVPPPQLYHMNQPRQDFPEKPKVPPEVAFKDLKATVNKLFGANEGTLKQENNKPQVPLYVTQPDPEKWDMSHPDTRKFNASVGSKNIFNSPGKNVDFSSIPERPIIREEMSLFGGNTRGQFFSGRNIDRPPIQNVPIPPPDAKVSFCDVPSGSSKGNLFPVVNAHMNPNFNSPTSHSGVSDVKVSLAQRLASVLVKVGMIDVPAPLLQEMLMKIGAFSSSPRQDISESEILSILKRLGYLS